MGLLLSHRVTEGDLRLSSCSRIECCGIAPGNLPGEAGTLLHWLTEQIYYKLIV